MYPHGFWLLSLLEIHNIGGFTVVPAWHQDCKPFLWMPFHRLKPPSKSIVWYVVVHSQIYPFFMPSLLNTIILELKCWNQRNQRNQKFGGKNLVLWFWHSVEKGLPFWSPGTSSAATKWSPKKEWTLFFELVKSIPMCFIHCNIIHCMHTNRPQTTKNNPTRTANHNISTICKH